MSPMRRTGTIILWFLWFAVVAVPWSETRLPLFTNLAVAVHALLAAAWFWALATALGWKVLGIANRRPRASRGELPTCPAPGGDAGWGMRIPVVQGATSPRQDAIRLLFAAGIGLGLLAAANLVWGTFVGVSRAKFLALDALLAILAGGGWARAGRAAIEVAARAIAEARRRPLLMAGLAVLLLGTLPFALTPTVFPDTLRYHFGLARFYEAAGRIVSLPDFAESNISLNWQMLSLGQLEVGGEMAAQAFNWMALPLIAAALALAAPPGGRLLAIGVAISTPFLLGVSATANNDLGVVFFATLMWLALREGEGRGRWFAAGVFGGLAIGTKYPAAYAVASLLGAAGVGWAWAMISKGEPRHKDGNLERRPAFSVFPTKESLALFLFGGFLGYLPWFIRGAWLTGDPLYPALSRFLPWATGNGRWVAEHYAREMTRYGGGMEGLARWLLAPWRAILAPDPWFESDLGLAAWLALPLAVLAFRGGPRARFIALAMWIHGAAWAAGPQVTRFLAAAAPAFALAAAEGWIALRDTAVRRTLKGLLLVAIATNIWLSWMALAELADPFAWFLKRPSREAYLAAQNPLFRTARELERRTGARGTVLLFGIEGYHFFANPIRASGPFDPKWIVRESAAARTPEELAARLRAAGIRFLFLDPRRIDYLDRQFGYASWPDAAARARFMEMARHHTRPFLPEFGEGLRDLEQGR